MYNTLTCWKWQVTFLPYNWLQVNIIQQKNGSNFLWAYMVLPSPKSNQQHLRGHDWISGQVPSSWRKGHDCAEYLTSQIITTKVRLEFEWNTQHVPRKLKVRIIQSKGVVEFSMNMMHYLTKGVLWTQYNQPIESTLTYPWCL